MLEPRPANFPNRAPLDFVDIAPDAPAPIYARPMLEVARLAGYALLFATLFGVGMLIGWLT